MIVGYARTSTVDQAAGLDAQLAALHRDGCEKIFSERVSSVAIPDRVQLAAALTFVRGGDVFVVTRLDRLARSTAHLLEVAETLEKKGVTLRVLDPALDTSTATGRMLLSIIGAVAQFERELMLERQRVGIEAARAEGRYSGRPATARAKWGEARRLLEEGVGPTKVAEMLGISMRSVYRAKGEAKIS